MHEGTLLRQKSNNYSVAEIRSVAFGHLFVEVYKYYVLYKSDPVCLVKKNTSRMFDLIICFSLQLVKK